MLDAVVEIFLQTFEIVTEIINIIYDYPLITRITKQTLMGNIVDKTIEYYTLGIETSPLDEDYYIKYIHKNENYMIVCDKDNYNEAIKYIKSKKYTNNRDKILSAYEKNLVTKDVTTKVKMLGGPEQDFYKNTEFHTKKKHITLDILYILTSDLKLIHINDNEENISIE
jgi:hypothetical protein